MPGSCFLRRARPQPRPPAGVGAAVPSRTRPPYCGRRPAPAWGRGVSAGGGRSPSEKLSPACGDGGAGPAGNLLRAAGLRRCASPQRRGPGQGARGSSLARQRTGEPPYSVDATGVSVAGGDGVVEEADGGSPVGGARGMVSSSRFPLSRAAGGCSVRPAGGWRPSAAAVK